MERLRSSGAMDERPTSLIRRPGMLAALAVVVSVAAGVITNLVTEMDGLGLLVGATLLVAVVAVAAALAFVQDRGYMSAGSVAQGEADRPLRVGRSLPHLVCCPLTCAAATSWWRR